MCDPLQITELSKEVFRLKEALGALSPPLCLSSTSTSSPQVNPGQQMALQNRVSALTQQLQVSPEKLLSPRSNLERLFNCGIVDILFTLHGLASCCDRDVVVFR